MGAYLPECPKYPISFNLILLPNFGCTSSGLCILEHNHKNKAVHFNFQNSKETIFEIGQHLILEFANDIYKNHYDLPTDEIELMGFIVSGSLFDLAKSDFKGDAKAKDLLCYEGKTIRMVGDFVTEKYVKTKYGDQMRFGTFWMQRECFSIPYISPRHWLNFRFGAQGYI